MILFTIKKTFFDIWDHLFTVTLLNIGFTILVAVNLSIAYMLLNAHSALFVLGIGIGIVLLSVYIGAASMVARDIADYKSLEFKKFFQYIRQVWKSALVFSVLVVIQVVIFRVIIPWYVKMGGFFGIVAMGLLFWLAVIWLFAGQYYFPVRSRLDTNARKIIRKSIVLFFDNTFFTFVLGMGTLVLFLLSSFTAFLLPGIVSILIWHQVGLKLRLYKYEYLEKHPEANRKRIPWDALLREEREGVGKRTLRNMIFPWKE